MDLLDGYPKYAHLVSHYPGMAMYRRFARLNAQNLLYMQSELAHLELELDTIAKEDSESDDATRQSFQTYAYNMRRAQGADANQWKKVIEIRNCLREYNEALLQNLALHSLPKPRSHDRSILKDWLNRPEGGNQFFRGLEDEFLDSSDLIAISKHQATDDLFTRWVSQTVVPLAHKSFLHRYKVNPTFWPLHCSQHILRLLLTFHCVLEIGLDLREKRTG
ncbi:hypothetical protein, variant [Cladophialophora immunda]|uniref:DUF6594 domain-containing protein n=1 Tax=Cladophialophora immunda TaxID=569365 RepID=A0A0D2D6Y7_9EURO|nr:hypothetical protein, variant [Cladophialophora immunda]KIW31454.1 hypothetical protein, variant [Cladophialophora immunda]